VYSAAIPQRADMVLERCTNTVATQFGVTVALNEWVKNNHILSHAQFGFRRGRSTIDFMLVPNVFVSV